MHNNHGSDSEGTWMNERVKWIEGRKVAAPSDDYIFDIKRLMFAIIRVIMNKCVCVYLCVIAARTLMVTLSETNVVSSYLSLFHAFLFSLYFFLFSQDVWTTAYKFECLYKTYNEIWRNKNKTNSKTPCIPRTCMTTVTFSVTHLNEKKTESSETEKRTRKLFDRIRK